MARYDPKRVKTRPNRPNASDSKTLSVAEELESAFTDAELDRLETTLGSRARRSAVARFDILQMHLPEFTDDERRIAGGDAA